MKNTLIAIIIIALLGLGLYAFMRMPASTNAPTDQGTTSMTDSQATSTADAMAAAFPAKTVIGTSVQGREITAYHFGTGSTEVLFVGGIHGGYAWNTALVAYNLVQYLQQHPEAVPQNERVTVIPVLNPDGLNKVVGTTESFSPSAVTVSLSATIPGRFNANNVDLNRNFDCDWQSTGTWQNKSVSGGTEVFSEPESQAMREYILAKNPKAVIVWYSAAGGVYASSCHKTVLPETATIMNAFAKASGYPAHESFDFYATTGDMVNWLAKNNIPAISVLLTNHTDVEWEKNKAGVEAVLKHYAQ